MDLHLIPGARATAEERDAVEAIVSSGAAPPPDGTRRHLLLPALLAVQRRAGWISPGALNEICTRLSVAPADAYGVLSFYALLAAEPRPRAAIHVCDDIACRTRGGLDLCAAMELGIGPEGKPGGAGGDIAWHRSPCLGLCERAPAALVQVAGAEPREAGVAPASARDLIAPAQAADRPRTSAAPQARAPRDPALRLLRRAGLVDPASFESYRAHGGTAALTRALAMGPEGVIHEMTASKLLGRGGAAFPAGRKWDAVAKAPATPHYVVCNADESEPGTFKDRVLMEEDPFAVVEAMTIAGIATGCRQGYIYIRAEYPEAASRLATALVESRRHALLGTDVMGSGIPFDLEIRRGGGAYICGEETALFNSIEGYRGEPRNKPPFPVESGLFGKPTLINNVETFVNVLDIVLEGGDAFARIGTPGSTGTKLFCLSGAVASPGLYEVVFGATLRSLLDLAGGVAGGGVPAAILLGGAAGSFVTADQLDIPLTFEGTRAAGTTLGSGVIMVFDEKVDLEEIVLRIASFFRHESCGQCVPCRIGTQRQEEILKRLKSRKPHGSAGQEIALLADVARAMGDASICGLGQTAAAAVQSSIGRLGLFDGKGRA